MSKKLIYLTALLLMCGVAHAEPVRLSLKITAPIGATNGSHCVEEAPQAASTQSSLTLTEQDVVNWNEKSSTWTLDPKRFSGSKGGWKLADHCYELAIDGKTLSKGLLLWRHSARLTGFDVLDMVESDSTLQLQLLSSNHGSHIRQIHRDELNSVLGNKTREHEFKPQQIATNAGQDENIDTDTDYEPDKKTFDSKGRLIRVTGRDENGATGVIEYIYHPLNGKLILVLSKYINIEFRYDLNNNLIEAKNDQGLVVSLMYGKTPLIQRMVASDSKSGKLRQFTLKYNASGKLDEIALAGVGKLNIAYNDNGEMQRTKSPQGKSALLRIIEEFERVYRLLEVAGVRFEM